MSKNLCFITLIIEKNIYMLLHIIWNTLLLKLHKQCRFSRIFSSYGNAYSGDAYLFTWITGLTLGLPNGVKFPVDYDPIWS